MAQFCYGVVARNFTEEVTAVAYFVIFPTVQTRRLVAFRSASKTISSKVNSHFENCKLITAITALQKDKLEA